MRRKVESLIKKSLRKLGIDISYATSGYRPELYNTVLIASVSVQPSFNIIQVGANDGMYEDPIYEFVREHQKRTNIILIEPQKELIPYLKENYSYHPSSEVYNKAIGTSESTIPLYRIKKNYWEMINVDYGECWPEYRAPTGVTTSNKKQLLDWVSEHIQTELEPSEIIEKYDVDVIQPSKIINRSQTINKVHLLQVDAEGLDNKVVYNFFDNRIFPSIINIENKHLDNSQSMEYENRLASKGYRIYDYTADQTLALRSMFDD